MRVDAYDKLHQWDKAVADYSKLIVLDGQNSNWWEQRARAYSNMGQHDHAAVDYDKAVEFQPDNTIAYYWRALAHLGAGDMESYRIACDQMLERFGQTESPAAANWVAWTCALAPDAVADFAQALRLAKEASQKRAKNVFFQNTPGAVHYRAGRFEEAIERLTETDRLLKDPQEGMRTSPAYAWFLLAMAHYRLGQEDEAKAWLDKAIRWTEKVHRQHDEGTVPLSWNRRLTLQLLRSEAETLIGSDDEE
jgi:tetratricopeptide (TPR) repeat protein